MGSDLEPRRQDEKKGGDDDDEEEEKEQRQARESLRRLQEQQLLRETHVEHVEPRPSSTVAGGEAAMVASGGHQPSASVSASASASRPAPVPRQPSIRIRSNTLGSSGRVRVYAESPVVASARPRSHSQTSVLTAPPDAARASRSLTLAHQQPAPAHLPRLTEEGIRPSMTELGFAPEPVVQTTAAVEDAPRRSRRMSRLLWPASGPRRSPPPPPPLRPSDGAAPLRSRHQDEYDEQLVDWLDIIDPEVQTLSTLTNVQNSLFVPDLGNWVNRRPTYVLSHHDGQPRRPTSAGARTAATTTATASPPQPQQPQPPPAPASDDSRAHDNDAEAPPIRRSATITSRLSDSHYAALPHGKTLEGWSAADKWELDDHVRHLLHSRRARFKRTMKGFGQYVRRPLGFFVTVYATLITLFGLAWVLFLIGWIYVGEKQVYAIHIIDSVLVALFAIMGDGLAPFRAIDTYHMIFVVHYMRIIKAASRPPRTRLRKRRPWNFGRHREADSEAADAQHQSAHAPRPPSTSSSSAPVNVTRPGSSPRPHSTSGDDEADDVAAAAVDTVVVVDLEQGKKNSVEARAPNAEATSEVRAEAEAGAEDDDDAQQDAEAYYPLTPKQRRSLLHHQNKLSKSHSFYKPQETMTHYSFPLAYLMAIVILLDCHSCLQISLGACTWGIDYHVRPFALTTVILCVSISCNLSAGIVIMVGDRKTRKKDVIRLLNRQELTDDAIKTIEHRRQKRHDRRKEELLDRIADSAPS
ncbi:hypothetical protein L249_4630 [Ophiocordyceps polyrhachis-furcata BCC 54312]|uniref:Integral membrane protein n=1 Tax=Ophiocordyceps polyrhachis-furcata BCC 54312 TaxID=1330021 RepID=A0A367L329_9HYPO|nr:hypothetical protein L249_4630 [Ophiocordyceps polyrhachis-furcata BCC 54312]